MILPWMCRQVIVESSVSICEFNTLLKSTWAVLWGVLVPSPPTFHVSSALALQPRTFRFSAEFPTH